MIKVLNSGYGIQSLLLLLFLYAEARIPDIYAQSCEEGLKEARQAFEQNQFPNVYSLCYACAEALENPNSLRAGCYEIMARAYFVEGYHEKAYLQIKKLLFISPNYTVTTKQFPPKYVELVKRAIKDRDYNYGYYLGLGVAIPPYSKTIRQYLDFVGLHASAGNNVFLDNPKFSYGLDLSMNLVGLSTQDRKELEAAGALFSNLIVQAKYHLRFQGEASFYTMIGVGLNLSHFAEKDSSEEAIWSKGHFNPAFSAGLGATIKFRQIGWRLFGEIGLIYLPNNYVYNSDYYFTVLRIGALFR